MRKKSGQVVLVLVLITVIGLTVGLSLIARTISDVRISSQIEQSSRAFSAAEAGVESALRGTIAGGTPSGSLNLSGGASANYAVKSLGGTSDVFSFPVTDPGKTQVVWLANHTSEENLDLNSATYPADSSIDICWGSKSGTNPAISIGFIYFDGADYKLAKLAIDSTNRGNNFVLASDRSGSYCGGSYLYRHTVLPTDLGITTSDKLIFMRIQPVYVSTSIAIKPSVAIPVQGTLITSVGQTDTGNASKIEVNRGYPILPNVFDFGLFSEN